MNRVDKLEEENKELNNKTLQYIARYVTGYIGEINSCGQRHGQGIEYHKNGNKMYESNYIGGERHGKGIEYYENGNKGYEGEFENGKFKSGTFVDRNGVEFLSKDLVKLKKKLPLLNANRRTSKRKRQTTKRYNL